MRIQSGMESSLRVIKRQNRNTDMDLARICKIASDRHASDIHLKPSRKPILRVDGQLTELQEFERLTPQEIAETAKSMMNERQLAQYKEKHELDLAYSISGSGRYRTSIYQQRGTIAISLRLIGYNIATFKDLNLPEVLMRISEERRGLVVVTGSTGSGKSTTLAAMIEYINSSRSSHIITIEDPIEFLFKDKLSVISQREIGFDTYSFAGALRAALRQDPDVILVGEMRDKETIQTALMAAETGHLVLSTLHTTDVKETVNRVLAFWEGPMHQQIRHQISGCMKAIISQRLVSKKDGKGRVPACEILVTNARVRDCIIDPEKTIELNDAMIQGAVTDGMMTFDMSLLDLVKKNLITRDIAMESASNPGDMALKLKGISATKDSGWSDFEETPTGQKAKKAEPKSDDLEMLIERFHK